MNINGRTMIFKNEYGYSTTISRKNQNEEYEKMYVSIQLPKGVELDNKTIIDFEGFLTFYKNKEGLPKIKIVVMKYEIENQYVDNDEELYSTEDLPF